MVGGKCKPTFTWSFPVKECHTWLPYLRHIQIIYSFRFLDEYYSKYAGRTTGMESTDRMDSYDSYESEEDMYEEEARNMPDYR